MKHPMLAAIVLSMSLTTFLVLGTGQAFAEEATIKGPQTGQEFVSQQSLKQQVALAKQRLEAAQAKLTAMSGCHANNMLYVMRNGVAQCWNPVATFVN
jgi:hypothetical protein